MDLGLRDKRAIITGATKGIGRHILELLISEGCNVATCSRSIEDVNDTIEKCSTRKAEVFGSLEGRVREAGFADPERYVKYVNKGEWNNARMMQFRTYNRSRDWFHALYVREGEDLLAFMQAVKDETEGADDPYRALALAVGADPDAEE